MIVDIEDVLALDEYEGADEEDVRRKVLGIESAIRAVTNNDFVVRGARIVAPSHDGAFGKSSPYIVAGDRVQIARSGSYNAADGLFVPSGMNDGLYDVSTVTGDSMTLDRALYDLDYNELFLVKYPPAIVSGVFNILKWEALGRDKVGVSSETISRHSVSYHSFTDSEMVMGYPAILMGFIKPYMRARF